MSRREEGSKGPFVYLAVCMGGKGEGVARFCGQCQLLPCDVHIPDLEMGDSPSPQRVTPMHRSPSVQNTPYVILAQLERGDVACCILPFYCGDVEIGRPCECSALAGPDKAEMCRP